LCKCDTLITVIAFVYIINLTSLCSLGFVAFGTLSDALISLRHAGVGRRWRRRTRDRITIFTDTGASLVSGTMNVSFPVSLVQHEWIAVILLASNIPVSAVADTFVLRVHQGV
jgi:hypothetical protein